METYLVTFSINLGSNLKKTYDDIKRYLKTEAIRSWVRANGSYVELNKTTFVINTYLKKDDIRDKICRIFNSNGTDGNVFIVEIKLSGWSFHGGEGELSKTKVKWLKQNISCIDEE